MTGISGSTSTGFATGADGRAADTAPIMKSRQIWAGTVPPLIPLSDQIAGKADEQGVAAVLASTGLAKGVDCEPRAAPGAVVHDGTQQVEQHVVLGIAKAAACGEQPVEQAGFGLFDSVRL